MTPVLWDLDPEVELSDLVVTPFWIPRGIATAAPSSYVPANRAQGFRFLHIFVNILSGIFLQAILTDVKWYLVFLLCVFLKVTEAEHPFICFLAISVLYGFLWQYPLGTNFCLSWLGLLLKEVPEIGIFNVSE